MDSVSRSAPITVRVEPAGMSARTTTEADVNFARLLDLLSTFRRRDEVSGVVYADKGKLPEAVSLTNTAPGGFSEARGIITP